MDKLRLRFEKTGRAAYISHLDLMSTVQRAFSRAGYRLRYSEGFNPRPQISIALPLSVGAESLCEILDFKLAEEPALGELPGRLTAALPEGIRVIEVYEPQRKIRELKWLGVSGVFEYDARPAGAMAEELTRFYAQKELVILKRTKRGEGETDIRPAINSVAFEAAEGAVVLSAVVSAQEPTLNPELLAEALRQRAPGLAPDFARFRRTETYDAKLGIFR